MLIRVSLSLVCVLGLLNTHTLGSELSTPPDGAELAVLPHFTECRSREQETFRCWWSSGTLSNLSEPGALGVFYRKGQHGEWHECPEYTPSVLNECYFNKTFTSVWTVYCLELRSTTQNVTYHNKCFTVENIVYPDPPVGLNWTLLNVSRSGLNFDVLVHWTPPPSADTQMGWLNLKYEVQYRVQNSSHWDKQDLESGTQKSIYALNTHNNYEVRVRTKLSSFENFGEFSESIFVQAPPILNPVESTFPIRMVLIVSVISLLILLTLLVLSQQQRLMVILLPPVPAPKIKGIDPEILKKGKLDQLNFLLSNQHMYKPDTYPDDSWVEFIQIDLDEALEKDESSDTHRLLGPAHHGSAHCLRSAHKGDDDSGLEMETDREERHPLVGRSDSTPTSESQINMEMRSEGGKNWANMDFYAQVSDVTPAGGVVLAPEQQITTPVKKKDEKHGEKKNNLHVQLIVVEPDGGYSSESAARQVSPESPSTPDPDQPYHVLPSEPEKERPLPSTFPPLSEYTVVQEVDEQHSVLLNPSSAPASQPQNPSKCPPVPIGYLTPELLDNFSP
ncbi:growth hormone receptor a [Trichomycterus rosablanca]|uniref:growth hormone receptor a n=1 Tax=Trichomycterus rosablanca TaxID=2290929 RepID=UPI002F35E7C0